MNWANSVIAAPGMHRDFAASHTVCRQRTWRAGHAAAAVPPGGASTQSRATCFTAM